MPAPPTHDDWLALTRGERPALERLYRAHAPATLGQVKVVDFAQEFAAAYRQA